MKTILNVSAVAVFLVVAPGVCFALWDVEIVSKERAKELGMEVRSTAAGANHVQVGLEFKAEGALKNFSHVDLRFGKGDNVAVAAPLREDRSKPGRVAVSFTADLAQLDKLTLRVMVPFRDGGAGGTTHELRVKDFVEDSSSGPRTTPATESIKGQLIGLAQLVDAGNATPEAAWESRYWARAQGDYDAVIAATDPQKVDTAKAWMGDKETFRARSQAEFASFKGIQISARKNLANDRVELKYQFAFGKRQETKIVEMVKIEGAWKSGQTRVYDASWDDGSQPEPQP